MAGDLGRRLAVAGVGIPLGILLIYLGGWALGVTVAVVAALGTREFYSLAERRGANGAGGADPVPPAPASRPFRGLGIVAAVALVLAVAHDPVWPRLAGVGWAVVVALLIVSLGAAVFRRGPEGKPLASTSATVAGVLYAGGTLVFALLIRNLPEAVGASGAGIEPWHGAALLIFPLTAAWFGDSAAYFAGSRWGRRRLFPSASPKKSVEGAVAGLLGSVLVGGLFGALVLGSLPVFSVSPLSGAVIGLLVGLAAQVGDLAESVLKRDAGVKDSGTLLPGHGGVLDRFDGILVTLPLAYMLIVLNRWLGF
jgi:phosphatidate cytidylyltransferase